MQGYQMSIIPGILNFSCNNGARGNPSFSGLAPTNLIAILKMDQEKRR